MRLGEHVCQPAADHAVGAARDEVVSVLRADHLHAVDRVGVACGRERRLEHRQVLGPRVPEQDLARVRATKDVIRMERRKRDRENVGLSVERMKE
jgi:hypothetical protein